MPRYLFTAILLILMACPAVPSQELTTGRPAHDGESEYPEALNPEVPRLEVETRGYTSSVVDLDFSPDGRLLAAAGTDKVVRIWRVADGQLHASLRGQEGVGSSGSTHAVAFSPDGKSLVVGVSDEKSKLAIRVYETGDLDRIARALPQEHGIASRLAFSKDGRYLAVAGPADLGTVEVWDWPARQVAFRCKVPEPMVRLEFPTRHPLLIVKTGKSNHAWSIPHRKGYKALAEAELLEFGDLFGARSPEQRADVIKKIAGPAGVTKQFEAKMWNTASYFETGHAVNYGWGTKSGRDHYWAAFWSTGHPGGPVSIYEGHHYLPRSVAASPDRSLVASGDDLGEVHVWEAATGRSRLVLRGLGKSKYRVGFDPTGHLLAFGSASFPTGEFNYNHYGKPDRAFHLRERRLVEAPRSIRAEETALGGQDLKLILENRKYVLHCYRGTTLEWQFPDLKAVRSFTFLRSPGPGFATPVVLSQAGGLSCFDPHTMMARRLFIGHRGDVMSLSESPDGRFLASGSIDGTVRIWSLESFRPRGGKLGFYRKGDAINVLAPDGPAARAGLMVGDRLLKVDGQDFVAYAQDQANKLLSGSLQDESGRALTLEILRGKERIRKEIVTVPGPDFVEPLLSLFVAADGEWVLWTPQGYYDASLGGDRLIGWHVNQGPDKPAKFYLAQQFRGQFYRPDVIDEVLELGDVPRAVARANASRPRATAPLDLRDREAIRKVEPPKVRILEPLDGSRTRAGRIRLRAEVTSQNDLPIRQVTVLLNGRPATGRKDVVREPELAPIRDGIIEREVDLLPGLNRISVIAANEVSPSQPQTVAVSREAAPASASSRPNLYVLAIGVSEYAQGDLNLRFAHRDAEVFASTLQGQAGKHYEKVEVRALLNKDATVKEVLSGMDWLVRSATSKDSAVLFVSAHGVRDERQNFYLATHEIDLKSLRSTAVRFSEVKSLIQDVPGKFLLFIDTCHSGGITGAKGAKDLGDAPLRELVSEDTGAIVFASSMAREVSLEDPKWGHGAFTRALLDIMSGGAEADHNKDGLLSLSELHDALAERVKLLTEGRQHTSVNWPATLANFDFFKLDATAR